MTDLKNALVTGANAGIGKEIVRGLAKSGFHVYMLCRNSKKADAARAELLHDNPAASLEICIADLSDLKQIDQLASTLRSRLDGLDVLVNNAGLYLDKRHLSVDGYEMTMAVNHLAVVALTERLSPLLVSRANKVGESRIVTVASRAHRYGRLDLNDLNSSQRYNGMLIYGRSKMANIRHTRHLAKKLVGTGVSVNCLHPGVIASEFAKGQGGLTGWAFRLFSSMMLSPEEGADTALYLAISHEVKGKTGGYYYRRKLGRLSKRASDASLDDALFRISLEMVDRALKG